MHIYNLDENEAVIMQLSNALTYPSTSKVDLILTSKNLIQVNKGMFGGNKEAVKYPLSELKVYNGKANVLVGKAKNGSKQLELYFNKYDKAYVLPGLMTENKWAAAIIKAHKQVLDDYENEQKAVSGQKGVLKAISNTLESTKDRVITKRTPTIKTAKCSKCGAALNGGKGDTITCAYCGNNVTIR